MIHVVLAASFLLWQAEDPNADRVIRGGSGFSYQTPVADGSLTVTVRGDVVLTPDQKDVMHLAPDSSILLDERTSRRERRLEIRRDGEGTLKRTLIVNKELRLVDDETKAWLAAVLPDALKRSRLRGRPPGAAQDVKPDR
jgi:hypothetical protein